MTTELNQRIKNTIDSSRVVLFMKGTRQQPMCGFSASSSSILTNLAPGYASFNVLDDPDVREGIKAYGNWPTIPQLYIDGELDVASTPRGIKNVFARLRENDRFTHSTVTLPDAVRQGLNVNIEEIRRGIRARTLANQIVPVLCGSAFKNKGVQKLLDAVVAYLPSPVDVPPVEGHEMGGKGAGRVIREASDSAPPANTRAGPMMLSTGRRRAPARLPTRNGPG